MQNNLHEVMENISLKTRADTWIQHDGAPAHYAINVREFLNVQYKNKWIGYGGPVSWPAKSPNLTPIDFFCLGLRKG